MGKPAARIGDFHACPMVTPGLPPIPHVGGPVIMGSPNVLTGSIPQARVGDNCVCVGPPDVIVMGSTGVFVNNMPAARVGDQTAHGGMIAVGLPTVLIGDGGGGGAGAMPSASATELQGDTGSGSGAEAAVSSAATQSQVQSLVQAAASGAPFCEMCFQNPAS